MSEKKPPISRKRLKKRVCLCCAKLFASTGKGNRFCMVCKPKIEEEMRFERTKHSSR